MASRRNPRNHKERWVLDDDNENELVEGEYCCECIEDAIGDEVIVVIACETEKDGRGETTEYPGMGIPVSESKRGKEEAILIEFCPFCGAKLPEMDWVEE